MGATNCPETPRQRMISMMYLVYTAMLALNVSAEILQAFVTVGDSMEVTNKLLMGKAESAYTIFVPYGIETVPEAIEDAKFNAKLNNIENAEFFVGDVENVLPKFIKETDELPDVVFVDPPRKGCDKTAIDTLLKLEPKKIVYVSCNPATLGRDLKIFEEKYEIKRIAICDMFPYTHHVESVVMLCLR